MTHQDFRDRWTNAPKVNPTALDATIPDYPIADLNDEHNRAMVGLIKARDDATDIGNFGDTIRWFAKEGSWLPAWLSGVPSESYRLDTIIDIECTGLKVKRQRKEAMGI